NAVGEAAHGAPRFGVEPFAGRVEQRGGIENPAVAVELVLAGGAVANAHRPAIGVAGPALELALGGGVTTVQAEQHRKPRAVESAGVQQPSEEMAGLIVLAHAEKGADTEAGV